MTRNARVRARSGAVVGDRANGARECRRGRPGFTLVELIVAVVILQVGLLGVAGIMITAAQQIGRAIVTERAVALAEPVADSILEAGWTGPGQRHIPPYVVRWTRGGAEVLVEVRDTVRSRLLVQLVLPGGGL